MEIDMATRLVAVVEDGVWRQFEVSEPSVPETVEIVKEVPMVPRSYDDCVALLASVVACAAKLGFRDQQRVRDAAHAIGSLLSAQTRIDDTDDRKKFEEAVRQQIQRQR
jgi:hypothetical protein